MNCQYCETHNESDDHRCKRCGRRLHTDATPSFPVNHGNLAAAFDRSPRTEAEASATAAPGLRLVAPQTAPPSTPRQQPTYQGSLFGPQEVTSAPVRRAERSTQPAPRVKRDKTAQQQLNFDETRNEGSRTLRTSVEAAIYCNATAAPAPLRVAACLADLFIGATAVGLLLATINYSGQGIAVGGLPPLVYLAGVASVALLYRVLFCMGNGDTPGTRWAGLRVLNFDGRRPTRQQRFYRLAGGIISVIASGLGVIWALFDEEKLTWHDHMSKTFPAVADDSPLRRY
jgi:uncharacterized RDD family membrane protein YckC